MEENDNIRLLHHVYQNTKVGMNSADLISKKTDDPNFRKELDNYILDYQTLQKKVSDELTDLGTVPHEKPNSEKIKTWSMLQMSTISKKNTAHLAELMITGSTMGISQTTQDVKKYNLAGDHAKQLASDLITLQQEHIDRLKTFL